MKLRREIKMLRQVKYFKLYWAVLRYFGLQPHKINQREKFRAIFIFLILAISNIVLYIIEFVTTDDDEARISALQTFPCFILIFIEGANVAFKSKEIEETFNEFNEVFSKAENQVLMQKGFKKFMIYVYFNHAITMISYLAGILLFWFTGSTPVLIYTPQSHGLGFFAIWFLQSSFFIYCMILVPVLDQTLIFFMIFSSAYLKTIGNQFRTSDIGNVKDIIELNLKIKR